MIFRYVFCLVLSASAFCELSARSVENTSVGNVVDFTDAVQGHKAPFTIEKSPGRYAVFTKSGTSREPRFTDHTGRTGDYYRITDADGRVVDTLSVERGLFGDKVYVFSPYDNMDSVAAVVGRVDRRLFGHEMDSDRYALLFRPGDYREAGLINVPFYVHIAGLGATPYDVKVDNIHTPPHLRDGNGTCTFWRSVENLSVIGPATYDEDECFKWAVSQAAPMRRVYSTRNLRTQWANGWVSGGYAADCRFDAPAGSDHQQQWYYRNSVLAKGRGDYREEKYNYCFQGVIIGPEADSSSYTDNWDRGGNVTMVPSTPIISEKPFVCIGPDGRYKVFRPALRHDACGLSYSEDNPGAGRYMDILDEFDVIRPGATAADMNRSLAVGRSLLITPGMYELESPLIVSRPGTVVLGLGWATLIPAAGSEGAMVIEDVDDVAVASLLFDAHYSSDTMLKVGRTRSGISHNGHPTVLSDLFFRIGGFQPGPVHVDNAVEINSNDVVGDHFWIWRADHGVPNSVGWNVNTAPHGLVVNGDGVTVYGLFNEHFQQYQTLWNGENGQIYFYQCETPYDSPDQQSYMSEGGTRAGYAAYKVADHVKSHRAVALGIYDVLVNEIMIENSVEVPDTPGVDVYHVCNNSLSSGPRRGFRFVINGLGKSTYDTYRDNLVKVNDYRRGE